MLSMLVLGYRGMRPKEKLMASFIEGGGFGHVWYELRVSPIFLRGEFILRVRIRF